MIGLTPCFLHALYISTAPFITPWSVRPRAGWPNCAARWARASILHAPSSSEYSECTCRWAQDGLFTGTACYEARRTARAPCSTRASLFALDPAPRQPRHAVLVSRQRRGRDRRRLGSGRDGLRTRAQTLAGPRQGVGHLRAARPRDYIP